ncbi:ATP-binding protein [Croceicoccus sp. YJ47]|uniref:ATP-binding protein n=1 Tax=Croceicoccus sp. YJ47 TaxID=2798724 RepID=UPI001922F7E8|nr:ATP-binding protein [Croceicoccus sp. YJ47]QQN73354.1 ATP-binding protein [Croceicoccus sp. YJ47]
MPSRSDPFIRVPANLEAVRDLAAWAQGACSDAGVADDIALELELALVEAATNIVVHAMPGDGNADAVGEITCTAHFTADAVRFTLNDDGAPAPAGTFTTATTPADPLAETGRGMAILQLCIDELEYSRANGRNRLELRRRLPAR